MSQPDIDPEAAVARWNRDNHPGRAVLVLRDDGSQKKAVTRSEAYVAPSGTPVIFVLGIRGCYALERVKPYPGLDPEAALYAYAGGGCVCDRCGELYHDHPADLEYLGQHGIPFLTRLCDGRLVKL